MSPPSLNAVLVTVMVMAASGVRADGARCPSQPVGTVTSATATASRSTIRTLIR
jgi:hypothetical protein